MPDITLSHVTKVYDGTAAPAVADLDLHVEDGDFLCLLGPSGCGKTTTLRMIAGLENLTDGEIAVGERVVDAARRGIFVPPEKRGMGLVFQSYALWPHLTIERNTDFGLRLRKVPRAEREARVARVMEMLAIEPYRHRYPSQLSGGQQQRVAMARMLAVNPEVLLLDEPLSNLDARLRLEMRGELKRLHAEFGTTVVFVTHDQWEAMTLATRIAVMHEGALQQVGTPDDIYDRPANRFVAEFVGSPPINIVELAGAQGALARGIAAALGDCAAASVGLRPENLHIRPEGQGRRDEVSIPAEIRAVLPTGGSWIVEAEAGGQRLFTTASEDPALATGTRVSFGIPRARMHLFDAGHRRIEPGAGPDEGRLAQARQAGGNTG